VARRTAALCLWADADRSLDVYRPLADSPAAIGAGTPVAIFVHGGAWRTGAASELTFLAEPFVGAGASFAVLDFINVDDAGGNLFPMVEQVRRAVGWLYRNAESFGGDRDRLYLISHFVRIASCRLRGDPRLDERRIALGYSQRLSSGMYDLEPVRLSKRSKYVNFTDAMEHALSAIRHLDKLATPLILSYGTYETPEFQRQTRDFAAAVRAAGKPVEFLVGETYNHFEMLETLAIRLPRPRGAQADGIDVKRGVRPLRRPGSAFCGPRCE
jgi:arylformamidase